MSVVGQGVQKEVLGGQKSKVFKKESQNDTQIRKLDRSLSFLNGFLYFLCIIY